MKGDVKRLKVTELTMWDQNPRNNREWIFNDENKSEKDIIIEMLMDSRVRNSMDGLLDDLVQSESFKETVIVYEMIDKNGEITLQTLDGNRRMAAFRLINYPDIVMSNGFDLNKITLVNNLIKEIECSYYSNEYKLEALAHVEQRHSGVLSGEGRIDWNSNNKENIRLLMGKGNLSIGSQIIDFFKDSINLKSTDFEIADKIKSKGDKTTFDRIFGSRVIFKEKLNLPSVTEYDLTNPMQAEKVSEILKVFYKQTSGKVGDVYYKKDIEAVFANVQPLKFTPQQRTLFTTNEKKRRNNKYIQPRHLFLWRANGINIQDENFKYLLRNTLDRYEKRQLDFLPEFEIMVAPFLYRVLLELAIKYFISEFSDKANQYNIQLPNEQHLIDALNSNHNTSAVNSKKISAILNIAKRVKNQSKSKAIESRLEYFSKQGFFVENSPKLVSFIDQIHENVHGNKAALKKSLMYFDRSVKEFILLVNDLTI